MEKAIAYGRATSARLSESDLATLRGPVALGECLSPRWEVGSLDAGDGREVLVDPQRGWSCIRVSRPLISGVNGTFSPTAKDRDAIAAFIAAARNAVGVLAKIVGADHD